jgi:hypothetical protein
MQPKCYISKLFSLSQDYINITANFILFDISTGTGGAVCKGATPSVEQ